MSREDFGDPDVEAQIGATRKPVQFQLPSDVSEEIREVQKEIINSVGKVLYAWDKFPIELPASVATSQQSQDSLDFSKLFIEPDFNELSSLAFDLNGDRKQLNSEQLKQLRSTGEFSVESERFEGQEHRWRLNRLIQKGSAKTYETFLNGLASGAKLIIIVAADRFGGKIFSILDALKGWRSAAWKSLDLLIGMPSYQADITSRLVQERRKYLTAELDANSEDGRRLEEFCTFVLHKLIALREPSDRMHDDELTGDVISPPYVFCTPSGLVVDLRLLNEGLWRECVEEIHSILARHSRGWLVEYKQKFVKQGRDQGLKRSELQEFVRVGLMTEYTRRVFDAIRNSTRLATLQAGIGEVLIEQARSALLINDVIKQVNDDLARRSQQLRDTLRQNHPIRGRISSWITRRVEEFTEEYWRKNVWAFHERALAKCQDEDLKTTAYFLKRVMAFGREREAQLTMELLSSREPCRTFSTRLNIWQPANYIVTRKLKNYSWQTIPTVLREEETEDVDPRPLTPPSTMSRGSYRLTTSVQRSVSTRYPFWRWRFFFLQCWTWGWNSLFFFGVFVPLYSPVSLRALFGRNAYNYGWTLDHEEGVLVRDKNFHTQTLASRLRRLWTHVKESRAKFEREPDTGFLGKNVVRFMNRVWNYVGKLVIGGAVFSLVMPVTCLSLSLLSLVAALTVPVWISPVLVIVKLLEAVFLDLESHEYSYRVLSLPRIVLVDLVLRGLLQPVAAVLTATVFCPLAAGFLTLGNLVLLGMRSCWDSFMFRCIVKPLGRVPATEGFVARRVAGPGLAAEYFYQVSAEQALAALESKLEEIHLQLWESKLTRLIDAPTNQYRRVFNKLLSVFGCSVSNNANGKALNQLTERQQRDRDQLRKLLKRRRDTVFMNLNQGEKLRIKLPEKQLRLVLAQGTQIVQKVYTRHLFPLLDTSVEQFWENRELHDGQWSELTAMLFQEIFSENFLISLEDSDNVFSLKVKHLDLERYSEMISSLNLRDDLDEVAPLLQPPEIIRMTVPVLKDDIFDPHHQPNICYSGISRSPATYSNVFDHPAVISTAIWNRDNSDRTIDVTDSGYQLIISRVRNRSLASRTLSRDRMEPAEAGEPGVGADDIGYLPLNDDSD